MLILNAVFSLLSRKFGRYVTIKNKSWYIPKKYFLTDKIYKFAKKFNFHYWYVKDFDLFSFMAFIAQSAMFFRIIQLYLNLKFKYGVV